MAPLSAAEALDLRMVVKGSSFWNLISYVEGTGGASPSPGSSD